MRIVTVAICLGIIGSSTANLFFTPSIASDETLSVITIVDQNGSDEVFVAGENIIYKLSANLSQLMNVTVSNDSSVRVRGLSVSNGGQYIMACLTTGSCIGYDVINLNRTMSSVPLNEPGEAILTGDDPVVMFPGAAEGIVFTGTATDSGQYRMSLGQYRVSSGSIMADTTRDYNLRRLQGTFNMRIFKAGFSVDNFTYYIVEDDSLRITILRVCNETTNPTFQALYEVQLMCGQSALFAGASLYKNLPNFTDNSTDNTLILIVQPPAGGAGRLCTYKISDINTAMEAGRNACANNNPTPVVWDDFPPTLFNVICSDFPMCVIVESNVLNIDLEGIRGEDLSAEVMENFASVGNVFTSSVIVQVEEELLIFIATSNGVLLKYIFINENLSNSEEYNRTTITATSITSLQWSYGSDYVYGLSSKQVIAIPVEDCESFRECTSCTGLGDPLCGWCSIEKKCSRRSECSNNNETRRWIQDQTMCIPHFSISPNTHPVELINQQFNITADRLPPPLDDESYYCVFGDDGSSLLEGNLIPGVNFTDLTCNYSFIVEFSNGSDDTSVVDFSLRSNLTNINFVTIDDGFTFFDCSTHVSCCSCLSSNNLCGWCLYDKKCTSSSDQCRVSTDWINTENNSNTECPLILRSNVTDEVSNYQQPVGVLRNLSLNAINLPAPNDDYRYWCVISYNGGTSRIQAEYTGPNNGLVCVPGVNDFTSVSYVNDSSVSVLWMGQNVTYYLETEIVPVTVILYNCSALAGVCSSCLSVSNLLSLDCGWCHDSRSCVVTESCSASSTFTANSSNTCPLPQITMVNPNSGPYQGGTAITINGTDLGVVFEDIINITIGGALCMIDSDSYQPGVGFICKTSEFAVNPPVSMSVHDVKIPINRDGSEETAFLMGAFKYAMVSIANFTPERIPESGNIIITIFGNNFDISNPMLAKIELAEILCNITNREALNSTFVQCIAGSRDFRATGPVVFSIDNSVTESEGDFIYTDDPRVFSLRDNQVIMSGGNNIIFTGRNLDVVPTVMIIDVVENSTNITLETYNVSCIAQSDREISCTFPDIPPDDVEDIMNRTLQLRYSLVAASVPGLDNLHLMSQFVIEFVDDPVINCFTEPENYRAGSNTPIMIAGMNLLVVDEDQIIITVDDRPCNITSHSDDEISCIPPQSGSGNADFVVQFGAYLNYTCADGIDGTGIQIQYQEPVIEDDEENNLPIYIPIAVGAVILIIIVLFILILCVVIQRYRKKEKQSEKLFADLQMQLEEMESGLADECKTAFTELQTDLELVYHPSEGTLPFLDFRSFAMRFLFPRDQNHVVLRPLEIPRGANKDDVVRQLETFKNLLMNKKFIHTMVKTLEGNPQKFGIPDRCNVASYLMVAFQTDLDYATEILTLLLGDLIQRSLSTRQNPKLLLRRTESVAEKMLANWLCFLLYPYILDSCGESLYVLVKAIKARLEKGPIDVVTGEAKYSLSDERLLRHAIDPKPVEGYALSPTGEEIPVKMWECDTITQAKEKILDGIYKNNPVSSRPSITEIDLELATSVEHGVPLRDFDASNETDGEFKKINTLGHFHLHVLSAEAASNPKKLPPKFRLVTRRDDRSPVNVKADMVGTIILNPSALSSAHLSIAEDEKIYHLVKPEDNNVDQVGAGGGRQKLIREVFLPRLLATKRILQPFVDDLFKVVFTVPRGKPLPKAIKYLFDFLDWQAAHNGITDPEVLHTWKTNSLPLRFWVNVIKNPEFVFDINKSATVDSCLSTVASAYIDACSTKEYPYSKDAPASKLLYISEVKSYKANIQQYYQNIQSLPKIGDHEMATYLREVYQNQQSYFVAESAMYELFKYCKQYSEQLIENLEGDGLKSLATNFEKLLEEFQ